MACNTRVITSYDLDSELCGMIQKYDAGICVEPESVDDMVKAILTADQEKKETASIQSRAVVMEIASKDVCTSQYTQLFYQVLEKRKRKR